MSDAYMVGWSHSPFGKLDDPDIESLIERVARGAIDDAGVSPEEIDGVFVGLFNAGFSKQDFPSSLPIQTVRELRMKPAVLCENACASGSAAIHAARDLMSAGRGRMALAIGVEKMTAVSTAEAGDMQLAKADLAGVFNMGGAAIANYVSILERVG